VATTQARSAARTFSGPTRQRESPETEANRITPSSAITNVDATGSVLLSCPSRSASSTPSSREVAVAASL
jgi:hypothetical protein